MKEILIGLPLIVGLGYITFAWCSLIIDNLRDMHVKGLIMQALMTMFFIGLILHF